MATRDDHLDEVAPYSSHTRFTRSGRLAPFPGAPESDQIRCACDRCGTHLLAAARADGALDGSCPVCLNRSVTPVEAPRATA